jgi:hypothetical protein
MLHNICLTLKILFLVYCLTKFCIIIFQAFKSLEMTTATDKSVELIDISDDDDCSSVVSQPSSDIIFIEEVEFHNDQDNERSSKRKRRTKTIDVYFTSASGESNKLVTPLSLDTAPITGGVVTSENNGDLESNKISVSSGPSLLPPEGIAVPIKVYISLLCISSYQLLNTCV